MSKSEMSVSMTLNMEITPQSEYQLGKMLLVDKPLEWTSFDVVNKLRYALKQKLGIKKIKVGHAGTLDPLATGLLIIMTGKFTKTIDSILGLSKTYTGTIELGSTRPSYDMETEIDATFPTDHINDALVSKVIAEKFLGEHMQYPPMFSAIKIDGKRLYKSAREGIEVERPQRKMYISRFEVEPLNGTELTFEIECSKGTYIRSIANDIGAAMGSGGYLSSLRRTMIGEHHMKDGFTIEEHLAQIDAHI